ncbi:MAG: AMP-binding protein, partial [Gammaproteobacteria bacterium]
MPAYVPPSAVMSARLTNVGALFHARVPAHPDHRAVVDGERTLTYAELEARSNRLANRLLARGLEPGDRIALLARNRLEYLEVELAAAKSGLILAALNWRLADRELAHCINLVEPRIVIAEPGFGVQLDRLDIGALERIA